MIKSYGLFWDPSAVFWGRPNVPGSLLGRKHGSQKNPLVDFRDQLGVYVLYQDFDVVYVGMAENTRLLPRLRNHTNDLLENRWNRFSWFGILERSSDKTYPIKCDDSHAFQLMDAPAQICVEPKELLQHLEGLAIIAFEPPLNRQGPSFGKSAVRYVQQRHPCLGPTVDEMVSAIYNREKDGGGINVD